MKKLARVLGWAALSGGLAGAMVLGCAGAGQTTGTTTSSSPACEADTFRNCSCDDVTSGTQACTNGHWSACKCDIAIYDAGADVEAAAPECGDTVCNGTETCVTCPADCGDCPACTLAPTCTGASSVPSAPTALSSFDNAGQTMYSSGVGMGVPPSQQTECSDPLLKMRIMQILVHKNGSPDGAEMFCMVDADDGQSSQLMLTPDYKDLHDGNSPLVLSPSVGTFWGQAVNGVKLSQFNITVTYQCFMVLNPTALQDALNAIAGFAGAGAAIPGNPYGWAFGVGGAAAAAAAAAVSTGTGAVPMLNVQQTIDSGALLQLTNGYTWSIRQSGSTKVNGTCGFFGSCDWDWELQIEAWGCAVPKGQTPQ